MNPKDNQLFSHQKEANKEALKGGEPIIYLSLEL